MAEGSLGQHIRQAAFGLLVGPTAPRVVMGGLAQGQWLEWGKS